MHDRIAVRRIPLASVLLACALLAAAPAAAEPRFAAFREQFQRDHLRLGVLIQVVGDLQPKRSFPGENGFSIANMRVMLAGDLDEGFGYAVTANLVQSPAILDAKAYYRHSPALTVDVGQFKTPFSAEFLTPASGIDFVNRAQAVSALAPGRQIGVQARGRLGEGPFDYAAGVFNGNGTRPNGNDDDHVMVAGRVSTSVTGTPAGGESVRLDLGGHLAYSEDANAAVLAGFLPDFDGVRTLYGADVRATRGPWMAAAEALGGRFRPRMAPGFSPSGFHLTAGRMLNERWQALVRWDAFDTAGPAGDRDLIVLGVNFWPTSATELQFNYIIPTGLSGLDRHQLLINAQLAL